MEKTETKLELITKYFTDFTPEQLRQLNMLDGLYRDWNNKINVISRKDIDGLYEKHVLHSLSIAAAFEFNQGDEVIDIGTGGGFPGIPLAIFFPETKFHLVDSIGKKLKVVESVAGEIGLNNVTIEHTRAEEIRKRKFDCVVSRAVAPLKDLWTWSKPLLKKADHTKMKDDGSTNSPRGLICLKGGDLAQEIAESGTRPRVLEIFDIFAESFFHEKYIVFAPAKKV